MNLADKLISGGYLTSPEIIDAFRKIKRKDFLPDNLPRKELIAALDEAISIGFAQTISQPAVVAFMLELLNPAPGQIILDIGYGSGWTTALLAHIASRNGAQGKIFAVERIPELAEFGKKNIAKYNFIKKGAVECITGDGSRGFPPKHPYDRILASASARSIPEQWRKQLKIGGIIVAPIDYSIEKVVKIDNDLFKIQRYEGFVFVPLIEESPKAN